jgi:hypothetical protein
MVGALMVDGYGDGLVIECGSEDVDFLRTTGFGLLQASGICRWQCMLVLQLCLLLPCGAGYRWV